MHAGHHNNARAGKEAMPRASRPFLPATEVGGTYTLWEGCGNDFSSESGALTPENTIPSEKKPESAGT